MINSFKSKAATYRYGFQKDSISAKYLPTIKAKE